MLEIMAYKRLYEEMSMEDDTKTIMKFVEECDEALRTLNVAWAMAHFNNEITEEEALAGLHKARYETTGIDRSLRHDSRIWLEDNGYNRMWAQPWPFGTQLPGDEDELN